MACFFLILVDIAFSLLFRGGRWSLAVNAAAGRTGGRRSLGCFVVGEFAGALAGCSLDIANRGSLERLTER